MAEERNNVLSKTFRVKNHSQTERKRRYNDKDGKNQPKPRPMLDLSFKFPDGNSFEKIRTEDIEKRADGIVVTWAPNVGAVFVIDFSKITAVLRS
jgi:hypothetical protein